MPDDAHHRRHFGTAGWACTLSPRYTLGTNPRQDTAAINARRCLTPSTIPIINGVYRINLSSSLSKLAYIPHRTVLLKHNRITCKRQSTTCATSRELVRMYIVHVSYISPPRVGAETFCSTTTGHSTSPFTSPHGGVLPSQPQRRLSQNIPITKNPL